MGYDDARAAPAAQLIVNQFLCDGIKGCSGFVENDNGRIGDQSPCNLDALALAATEICTSFANVAVIICDPGCNLFVDGRISKCPRDFRFRHSRVPERQIVTRCSFKQEMS